jgi:hypothetical protein
MGKQRVLAFPLVTKRAVKFLTLEAGGVEMFLPTGTSNLTFSVPEVRKLHSFLSNVLRGTTRRR